MPLHFCPVICLFAFLKKPSTIGFFFPVLPLFQGRRRQKNLHPIMQKIMPRGTPWKRSLASKKNQTNCLGAPPKKPTQNIRGNTPFSNTFWRTYFFISFSPIKKIKAISKYHRTTVLKKMFFEVGQGRAPDLKNQKRLMPVCHFSPSKKRLSLPQKNTDLNLPFARGRNKIKPHQFCLMATSKKQDNGVLFSAPPICFFSGLSVWKLFICLPQQKNVLPVEKTEHKKHLFKPVYRLWNVRGEHPLS